MADALGAAGAVGSSGAAMGTLCAGWSESDPGGGELARAQAPIKPKPTNVLTTSLRAERCDIRDRRPSFDTGMTPRSRGREVHEIAGEHEQGQRRP